MIVADGAAVRKNVRRVPQTLTGQVHALGLFVNVLDCVGAWADHGLHLIRANINSLTDAAWGTSLPVCYLLWRSAQVTTGVVRAGANL